MILPNLFVFLDFSGRFVFGCVWQNVGFGFVFAKLGLRERIGAAAIKRRGGGHVAVNGYGFGRLVSTCREWVIGTEFCECRWFVPLDLSQVIKSIFYKL